MARWCRLGRDEDAAPAGRLSAAAPVQGCRSGGGLPATEGAGDNLGLFSILYWCRYFLRLFIEDRELAARVIAQALAGWRQWGGRGSHGAYADHYSDVRCHFGDS